MILKHASFHSQVSVTLWEVLTSKRKSLLVLR